MFRSFSHALLITWILLAISCKSVFVTNNINTKNVSVSVEQSPLDSQIVSLYLPFKTVIDKDMKRVISYSESEMEKGKPESGLTNLLADLILDEGRKFALKNNLQLIPVISYFNYGGIRTSLPKGEITVGKIFELMPFENEMVFIKLTGDQIRIFTDLIAEKGGDSMDGIRFVISNGKAKDIKVNGENLNPEKNYWLVTNDYVANGGDGLLVFTQRLDFVSTGLKIRDIIISNFEKRQSNGEVLVAKLDGRITNE